MWRYTFLMYMLLLPSLLMAQSKNISVAPVPDWRTPYQPDLSRKPDLKDISDGYYQVLYEEQRHLEKQVIYRHVIRQIVSEAGIQNGSEINVMFDPSYEKVQFHTIAIRRNGEIINRLDLSRFSVLQQEKELSRFIYSGVHNAYFIVEDVRKGDQIEYAYSVIGMNPIYQNKYCRSLYFAAYEPIMNYYRSLIVSPSRPIFFKDYNDPPKAVEKTMNGMKVYEWDLKGKVHVSDEEFNQPSWYDGDPYIELSGFANWAEVAAWGRQISQVPPNGPELNARIEQLKTVAKGDTMRYILEAIRFVQDDIRYMGIEMGEYSHRPNAPEKVCKQRFGDCKDKALLLCTLLRAYGVTAYSAFVDTDTRDQVQFRLPSSNQFDHVIAQFHFRGKTYWTDATRSYQRGPLEQRYNPEYGVALVISDTTTSLTHIPIGEPGKTVCEEVIRMPDTRNVYAGLKVRTQYTGYHADAIRDKMASDSRNGLQLQYMNFYKDLYGEAELVDSLVVEDDEAQNIVTVKESYKILQPWKRDSLSPGKSTFSTSAHLITDKINTAEIGRKSPFAQDFPFNIEQTIRIEFPEDWQLTASEVAVQRESYAMAFKPKVVGNIVTLKYEYKSFKDHIPVDEVSDYVNDMKQLNAHTAFDFSWSPGGAKTSLSGRTSEPGGVNWMAIGVALICLGAFGYICYQYYRSSIHMPDAPNFAWSISGPMIFIGVVVVLYPLLIFANVMANDSFQDYYWVKLYTDNPGRNISGLQLFRLLKIIGMMFFMTWSVFVAILFFQRRDLFPGAYSFMLVSQITLVVVDYLLSDYLLGTHMLRYHNTDFIAPLIIAGISIPYVKNSERSKHTFIIPYENRNGAF